MIRIEKTLVNKRIVPSPEREDVEVGSPKAKDVVDRPEARAFAHYFKFGITGRAPRFAFRASSFGSIDAATVEAAEIRLFADLSIAERARLFAKVTDDLRKKYGRKKGVTIKRALEVMGLQATMLKHLELLTLDTQ